MTKKVAKKIIEEQSTKINDKQIFIKENDCKKNLLQKKNHSKSKKNFAMSNKFRKFAIHFQRIKFLKKDITKCQEFAK